jgi:hypothetical protein
MQQNNVVQQNFPNGATRGYTPERVYTTGECLGSVIVGKCYGTLSPKVRKTYCIGTMVNGRCIGTVR